MKDTAAPSVFYVYVRLVTVVSSSPAGLQQFSTRCIPNNFILHKGAERLVMDRANVLPHAIRILEDNPDLAVPQSIGPPRAF